MRRAYAGIGSRETPTEVLEVMRGIGTALSQKGLILRTGGAQGADQAFWTGARLTGDKPEVYLPWPGFEGFERNMVKRTRPQAEAYDIAAKFHPRWRYLSRGAQHLHARNVHQMLGFDVTKPQLTSFIVCWTRNGKGGGGTGQALRIAKDYLIPIFDLGADDYRGLTTAELGDILPL